MSKLDLRAGESPFEVAEIEGSRVWRDASGLWRYTDTGIPVPGARDVTLTERFQPKQVVNAQEQIERVIVSAEDIASAPEVLDWCLVEGTPIELDGELIEVLVPYELWQERDRIPCELIAPEYHGTEAEQQVAMAERAYREAERQAEKAADYRAEVLRRYAEEMTRQEARAITGLSVGRIQQLIRSDRLEPYERRVLELFTEGPINSFVRFQKLAASSGLERIDEGTLRQAIVDLEGRNFLEPQGDGVGLTREGAEALAGAIAEAERG